MAVFGVFWAPMALLQQTAAYSITFVAQYYGAKKYDRIGPSIWQAVYFSVVGGILFLLLIPLSPHLFAWMGHSEKLQPLEVSYFSAICYSALPTALVACVGSFYTGLGRTRFNVWLNGVGMVSNIVFDYFLIFGKWGVPAYGVAGAGYATALANWVAALFGFTYLLLKEDQRYNLIRGFRFDFELMSRFMKYGLPSGMQWALEGLAFTVFLLFVGRMENGDAALAASGIAVTIMMLAVLPSFGVGQAVSILVGQFLGKKSPRRAEALSYIGLEIAALYIFLVGITFWTIPGFYLSWFENNANSAIWTEVQVMVPRLLIFTAIFTLFDSMNIVFSMGLRGAGDTRFVTAAALALPWPIMVLPTSFIVDQPYALYWAWFFASLFIVTQALVFWRRFVGGKWKQMSVIGLH